jgi:hypothetical protein
MKQNHHFIVPKSEFKLTSTASKMSVYSFQSHTAKHLFCKTCGICAFYHPRSNPDGVGITYNCLHNLPYSSECSNFDGQNWEDFIENSGIRAFSKT